MIAITKKISAEKSNKRVLKNTYALLALSLIPTIFGSIIGTSISWSLVQSYPLLSSIAFFAVSMGIFAAIDKTKDTGTGVALLLTFTGLMGIMLGPLLSVALSSERTQHLVVLAFGTTAMIFATMSVIAAITPASMSKGWGSYLIWGLVCTIAISIIGMFVATSTMTLVSSALAIIIFSAYLVHDLQRIIDGGETNYVMATLNLYLSIYNIFTSVLRLLMSFGADE